MNWALAAEEEPAETASGAEAASAPGAPTVVLPAQAATPGGAGGAPRSAPESTARSEAGKATEPEAGNPAEPESGTESESESATPVAPLVTPPAAAPAPAAAAVTASPAAATPEALAATVAAEPAGESGTDPGPRPGRVSRPMIAAAVAVGLVLVGASVVVTQLGGKDHKNGPAQADAPPGFGQGGGDGGNGFVPGYDEHGGTGGGGTPAPDGQAGAVVPPVDAGAASSAPGDQPASAPNGSGGSASGGGASGGGGGAAQPGVGVANTGAGAGSSTGGTGQAQGGSGSAASGGGTAGGAKPAPVQPAPPPAGAQNPAPPPAGAQNPAPPPVAAKPPAPVTAIAGPYCGGYRTNGWYDDGDKGWRNYSGGYSGEGCNGTYAAMPMSGDGNDKGNSVVWSFTLDKVTSCTLAVYIPASGSLKQVGGNPSYYTVQSGSGSAGSFTINQTASRGSWVTKGPFPYRGPMSLTLHDRGIDWGAASGAHHAASAVRATCTP
ncbi:hypothetical protein ACFZDG_03445 [Kitasatospora xanthocidica]|uniref:hypothetical protein n=1 Tax=Kitasatospora xanthocidica TaxID=83382 RepID=UPI0036E3D281